jgi:hypothetical protein
MLVVDAAASAVVVPLPDELSSAKIKDMKVTARAIKSITIIAVIVIFVFCLILLYPSFCIRFA